MFDFLNSIEIDILSNSENDCLTEHIKNRGQAMADIHNLWTIYDSKTGTLSIIPESEWELKMRDILRNKYGMSEEDLNRFRGQYFMHIREDYDNEKQN